MRFLLHPYRRAAASSGSTLPPKTTTQKSAAAAGNPSAIKAWGQQCSPNCGCVVRFEEYHGKDSLVVHQYTAKKVVTDESRRAILTVKGRPMIQDCDCPSLHRLASSLVNYYNDHKSGTAFHNNRRSDLEFQLSRSSKAFQRTVLRAQGLPVSDGHCFDVVEEAWTALIKGSMPKARRRREPVVTVLDEIQQEQVEAEEEKEEVDRKTWMSGVFDSTRSSLDEETTPRPLSSTLNMFDWNQEEEQQKIQRSASHNSRPLDWQTYVDQMQSQESA